MKRIVYREWRLQPERYWGLLAILGAVAAIAGLAVLYMEHEGHWVTGMTNQVVWGMPHIFAVFLIVAASGALNISSIGTVFGRTAYKPLGRLSGLLAVALLIGGLMVLVLDLGRPDRLIVAATTYNFRSIFAWNIFLYSGFVAIVVAYLWTMVDRKGGAYNKPAGYLAFVWRLLLTMGTGSIFGFLVARQAYDSAILPPMFIIMSFAYGLAIFMLVLMFAYEQDKRPLGDVVLFKLKNLSGVFIAAVLLMTLIYHLTKLYGAKNWGVGAFLLVSGGLYTLAFWFGWVLLGCLVPLGIVYHPVLGKDRRLDRRGRGVGGCRWAGGHVCHHHRGSGLPHADLPRTRRSWSLDSMMALAAPCRLVRPQHAGDSPRPGWCGGGPAHHRGWGPGAAVPARVPG